MSIYNSRRWRRLRKLQLSQSPLCELCQPGPVPATQVDHVKPIADGGEAWDMDNLRSLCASCHSRVTAAAKTGRALTGCGVDGLPLDRNHYWGGASD